MIAFIGAMDEEVLELLNLMDDYKKVIKSNVVFYECILDGENCIVLKSGIGKINAAMTTTVLLENYNISGVVNIGTAGGLKSGEKVLDVIVSKSVANYDVDVPGWEKGFDSEKVAFKADEKYINIMKSIISENDNVFVGGIASGDSFVRFDEQVEKILNDYPDALCAEMEAAGVAQVCKHYNKPFIVIRSLSDITVEENNSMQFEEYIVLASKRSAIWCKKFIKKLKEA